MIEITGDLWQQAKTADAVVIPTNGCVRRDGLAVMGRGVALQAKQQYPGIDGVLGESLQREGNHVMVLRDGIFPGSPAVLSFPTKNHWRTQSSLSLIVRSTRELVEVAANTKWRRVVLPQVGCGAGGLEWAVVQPVLAEQLDDRFVVCSLAPQ